MSLLLGLDFAHDNQRPHLWISDSDSDRKLLESLLLQGMDIRWKIYRSPWVLDIRQDIRHFAVIEVVVGI